MPKRSAIMIVLPANPPAAAVPVKAPSKTSCSARGISPRVEHQNRESAAEIQHRHEGHEHRRDFADARDAAENHDGGDDGQHDAGHLMRDAEAGVERLGERVRLDHVADAERGQRRQQREDAAEPRQAQALLQRVHRSAAHRPGFVGLAVVHRDDDLAVLGAHAEQARHPEPEERARAADEDRGGDAGDVAHADRRGQRRRDRLERRHGALALAAREDLAEHLAQGEAEPAELDQSGEYRQQHARAHQQHDHRSAPDVPVQRAFEGNQALHVFRPSIHAPILFSGTGEVLRGGEGLNR